MIIVFYIIQCCKPTQLVGFLNPHYMHVGKYPTSRKKRSEYGIERKLQLLEMRSFILEHQ